MSRKSIGIIFIIIIVGIGIIYLVFEPAPRDSSAQPTDQEQACLYTGGIITTSLCCKTEGDFPNTCLAGTCACPLENSDQIRRCFCGQNKCFDGKQCITLDEISVFLRRLIAETKIDFSWAKQAKFQWLIEAEPDLEEIDVEGKEIEAEKLTAEQEAQIQGFFIANGFSNDFYNQTESPVVKLTSFKKEQLVCIMISGITGYKKAEGDWTPPATTTRDIDLKCGKLEVTP